MEQRHLVPCAHQVVVRVLNLVIRVAVNVIGEETHGLHVREEQGAVREILPLYGGEEGCALDVTLCESFEDVFYLLKEKAFEELDLIRWPKEYFYAYKSNHIYENREDIRTLSPIEYLSKYKLLSFAEPTDLGTDSYEGKASSTEVSSVTHTIWFVRKVIGGFKCLRDNGFRYTIRRLGQKIKGRLMR